MKSICIALLAVIFTTLQAPCALAATLQDYRSEADQYYQQGNFRKAYKAYLKLAKTGDNYSQHLVSTMYANGEGKSENLTKAYAWSTLAAESGQDQWVNYSDELLQRINDKDKALNSANKLKKKYGQEALKNKAERKTRDELYEAGSKCTGSKMGCRRH
jgi:TPR repeat protein